MNKITTTIGGIVLLTAGAIGGATLTDTATAETLTKIDEKTAVQTTQQEVILDVNALKISLNDYQVNKQNIKMACDNQIGIYNTAIDEVKAKIQSLKTLGIE